MKRSQLFLAALLCGILLAGSAFANNAWFSLNLEFNDPTDFGSGGTWTVVAKADERGLASAILELQRFTLNFTPATGFLTPLGFEIEETLTNGGRLETVQADVPSSKTLDVGVIGGPYPSTYVDHPTITVFGSNPDLGSFSGGVELLTGSFDVGDVPAWWTFTPDQSVANIWANSNLAAISADVFLTVRYVAPAIPEPASILLLSAGMISLAAIRRRR